MGIAGSMLITAFGYLYLNQTANNYRSQIETSNEQLSAQNLTAVQAKVNEISNNLSLAVNVLSKQILFSGLLQQLATLLPSETNLTGLSISQDQGGVDISAAAKNYAAATQIQVNLSDPNNGLFSKADIISISCTGTTAYPCTVQVRALFAPDNPYMFTNNAKGS
ncbi:hypothetical protein KDA14_00020 [Candidatus Saccharibacteria bacterium]|nr:hypothetical protein [Candidatus Saccharibacteria bacterium]